MQIIEILQKFAKKFFVFYIAAFELVVVNSPYY